MWSAKVIADSKVQGERLLSLEVCYPRIILAELNTHRSFNRSSSSSRAIPVARMLEQVTNEPFIPIHWGKNQPGMQAIEEIANIDEARAIWLESAALACQQAAKLSAIGVHKQVTNRLLEPFQWTRTIITSSYWDNFRRLRNHSDAQPEIRKLVIDIDRAIEESDPNNIEVMGWHSPYVSKDESNILFDTGDYSLIPILSSARCARVSYSKHDGTAPSIQDDVNLFEMLALSNPAHMSPLEHPARMALGPGFNRSLHPVWEQFRARFEEKGWDSYPPTGVFK